VIGFQLKKGFLAGPGVAEVVSAECEVVDAPGFFFDVRSFAGEGDAPAARGVGVDPNTDLRVWAFAGEGEVTLGVVAALRARCGAGEGDAVFVAVGLFAAAAFS
jgi:hypothetical protein